MQVTNENNRRIIRENISGNFQKMQSSNIEDIIFNIEPVIVLNSEHKY